MASRNQPRPRYGKGPSKARAQEYCKAFTTAHFPPSHIRLSQRDVARRHHARQEVARLQAQIMSNLQQDFSPRVTAYHTLHKPCLGRRMSSDCTSPGQVSSRGVRSHGLAWFAVVRPPCWLWIFAGFFAVVRPLGRLARGAAFPRSLGFGAACLRSVAVVRLLAVRPGAFAPFAHIGHTNGKSNTGNKLFLKKFSRLCWPL